MNPQNCGDKVFQELCYKQARAAHVGYGFCEFLESTKSIKL